jgi:hypothetical protein
VDRAGAIVGLELREYFLGRVDIAHAVPRFQSSQKPQTRFLACGSTRRKLREVVARLELRAPLVRIWLRFSPIRLGRDPRRRTS